MITNPFRLQCPFLGDRVAFTCGVHSNGISLRRRGPGLYNVGCGE